MVKIQHNNVIKCLYYNLDSEYTSHKFSKLLTYDVTIHQASCNTTSQRIKVAKRKQCHIIETVCSLLLFASIPNEFWDEAILTNVHAIKRITSFVTIFVSF